MGSGLLALETVGNLPMRHLRGRRHATRIYIRTGLAALASVKNAYQRNLLLRYNRGCQIGSDDSAGSENHGDQVVARL